MTEARLFPRLSLPAARRLAERVGDLVASPALALELGDQLATSAASGGRTITRAELAEIRAAVVGLAREHGFPDRGDQSSRAAFDARLAIWWGEAEAIVEGEALRDEVWSWLTLALLPDVSAWRFPGRAADRFLGGVRNTFQRQWSRAWSLDRGVDHDDRWALVKALTEDALVQIMERPSLASQPRLARAIAETWVETQARLGPGAMEDLTRRAVPRVRMANEVIYLAELPDAEILKLTRAAFERARGAPIWPVDLLAPVGARPSEPPVDA
jgi:hypothetical protein